MIEPVRIQLRRVKGWKKPAGAVVVDRRTLYGNPFPVIGGDRAEAVRRYQDWITADELIVVEDRGIRWYNHGPFAPNVEALRGRDLPCWCPVTDEQGNRVPCHADVLLRLANPGWTARTCA